MTWVRCDPELSVRYYSARVSREQRAGLQKPSIPGLLDSQREHALASPGEQHEGYAGTRH